MSTLTDTLKELREMNLPISDKLDTLESEFKALTKRTPCGLVFERHHPEYVELWGHPIKIGSDVRVLPSKGSKGKKDNSIWNVRFRNRDNVVIRHNNSKIEKEVQIDNLVPVTKFGSNVFPGLITTDTVCKEGGGAHFTL